MCALTDPSLPPLSTHRRQTELIKSQDSELATLQQLLRQEEATNGVRRAYLEAAGKAKAGALGLIGGAVAAELLPALPPPEGRADRAEVESLQEEVLRLEWLAREMGSVGDAAEAQLADARRVLVEHALGLGLPREVVPVRWVGAASRNEVREALRGEGRGLLKKEVLEAACRAVEAAICDEGLDPLEVRCVEGAWGMGIGFSPSFVAIFPSLFSARTPT